MQFEHMWGTVVSDIMHQTVGKTSANTLPPAALPDGGDPLPSSRHSAGHSLSELCSPFLPQTAMLMGPLRFTCSCFLRIVVLSTCEFLLDGLSDRPENSRP